MLREWGATLFLYLFISRNDELLFKSMSRFIVMHLNSLNLKKINDIHWLPKHLIRLALASSTG